MATSSDASSDSSLQERKGTTKEEDGEKAVDGPETPAGVRDATAPEAAAAPAPAAEEAAIQEEKAKHARQASRKPGGARKNWQRRDGDSDTWTCPDCRRIIKNLQSSKDQHRVSAYCLSYRLWTAHCFEDWQTCKKYGEQWAEYPEGYEIRGQRFYQVKAPKGYRQHRPREPTVPPQRRSHEDRGREETRRRSSRSRSRQHARSRSKRHRLRSREAVRAERSAAGEEAPQGIWKRSTGVCRER